MFPFYLLTYVKYQFGFGVTKKLMLRLSIVIQKVLSVS